MTSVLSLFLIFSLLVFVVQHIKEYELRTAECSVKIFYSNTDQCHTSMSQDSQKEHLRPENITLMQVQSDYTRYLKEKKNHNIGQYVNIYLVKP